MQTAEIMSSFSKFESAPSRLPVSALDDLFAYNGVNLDAFSVKQIMKTAGIPETTVTVTPDQLK